MWPRQTEHYGFWLLSEIGGSWSVCAASSLWGHLLCTVLSVKVSSYKRQPLVLDDHSGFRIISRIFLSCLSLHAWSNSSLLGLGVLMYCVVCVRRKITRNYQTEVEMLQWKVCRSCCGVQLTTHACLLTGRVSSQWPLWCHTHWHTNTHTHRLSFDSMEFPHSLFSLLYFEALNTTVYSVHYTNTAWLVQSLSRKQTLRSFGCDWKGCVMVSKQVLSR